MLLSVAVAVVAAAVVATCYRFPTHQFRQSVFLQNTKWPTAINTILVLRVVMQHQAAHYHS